MPHVAALLDGGFLFEWTQRFGHESDGSADFGIVLQRFDKNGNAVGDKVIIDNPGDQGLHDASSDDTRATGAWCSPSTTRPATRPI